MNLDTAHCSSRITTISLAAPEVPQLVAAAAIHPNCKVWPERSTEVKKTLTSVHYGSVGTSMKTQTHTVEFVSSIYRVDQSGGLNWILCLILVASLPQTPTAVALVLVPDKRGDALWTEVVAESLKSDGYKNTLLLICLLLLCKCDVWQTHHCGCYNELFACPSRSNACQLSCALFCTELTGSCL